MVLLIKEALEQYFHQYIKGKQYKYWIKLYSLYDPHELIFMYCGILENLGGRSYAANVVLKLIDGGKIEQLVHGQLLIVA